MNYVLSVNQSELVEKTASELKKISNIKPPEWSIFVKTGVHKERPPIKKDWWYYRASSILKRLNRQSPLGVSKLRTRYGGRKNRGFKPDRYYRASGNIIRKILQQLDQAELTKNEDKKGRFITPKGRSLLNKVALEILGKMPSEKKKRKEKKDKITPKVEKKVVSEKGKRKEEKKNDTEKKVKVIVEKTKQKMDGKEKKSQDILKEIES